MARTTTLVLTLAALVSAAALTGCGGGGAVDLTALSASLSSVSAAPNSGLAADGSAASTITVTVRDAGGNPVAGVTVHLAASGAGCTVTQPSAPTDAAGRTTGSVVSTVAGTKTITAVCNPTTDNLTLTQRPTVVFGGAAPQGAVIVDHNCTEVFSIPTRWIDAARNDLHIAYGHTSHGSQITTGLSGLADWKGSRWAWAPGGAAGALDLDDYYGSFGGSNAEDLGNPDNAAWAAATRAYLNTHPDCNVIMWSWCGQVSDASSAYVNAYLTRMSQLEADYPAVRFVYMTGHLDGSGSAGNLHLRNQQIRNYCRSNDKVLFDFADLESYDPDGNSYLDRGADDGCYYDDNGTQRNWAQDWQSSHPVNVDWYNCEAAHTEPLNANRKAYAAWWLFARLAGWEG